jgi:hypothetical protein
MEDGTRLLDFVVARPKEMRHIYSWTKFVGSQKEPSKLLVQGDTALRLLVAERDFTG